MPGRKSRLDRILVDRRMVGSRQRARALIMAGKVLVDDFPVDKPGTLVDESAQVVIRGQDNPFVSRGGLKLQGALKGFGLGVTGLTCMDVGASTGGFTDCLLQNGAEKVFAVDVGYGQLAWKLRQDPRVIAIERTNIRNLPRDLIPCFPDLITIDVSFISLKLVVPATRRFLEKDGKILALIKPQFEVGKEQVGKGVVKDPKLHEEVIRELSEFFFREGFGSHRVVPSPVKGPKGNREFFILLEF